MTIKKVSNEEKGNGVLADVSGSLLNRIEKLATEIEKRYNECHFRKRGHIYADGFRNGAKCMLEILKGH